MKEVERINMAESSIPQTVDNSNIPQVFQYRTFRGFWSILKSDSFWATNARFSNDAEEQRFGAHVLKILMDDAELKENQSGKISRDASDTIKNSVDENYILCFCREDNKLSQWRGYARNGGCSIGFDLGFVRHYSLVDNKDEKRKQHVTARISKVFYMPPQGEMKNEAYLSLCKKKLLGVGGDVHADYQRQEIIRRAPYIKHEGFWEEDEYRLVFCNENGELDNCIRYKDTDPPTIKTPYVVVKAGDPDLEKNPCVIRVGISDKDKEIELAKRLRAVLPKTTVHACHKTSERQNDLEEEFCRGCGMRQWKPPGEKDCRTKEEPIYESGLPENRNCVFISQGNNQEEIHKTVYGCVKEFDKNIKVWCEGHLPIRSITVGPCENQATVKESISYYCKHTYWLQDVDIRTSDIPFRNSL